MSKICNNCGTNEEMAVMPIASHEKDQDRLMAIIRWLIAVIVVLIVLFVGYIAFDKWRDSQYEDVVETEETIIEGVTQETEGGNNNFVGGDFINGETNN